ncbi:hypothetical protein [Paenibacillus sp. FSL K6-0108]|uniref:hypothetical protein n=1 Tax=Paenibacillus sp. FSL K6-0108 TaxID=2921417 RepID=UPI0032559532
MKQLTRRDGTEPEVTLPGTAFYHMRAEQTKREYEIRVWVPESSPPAFDYMSDYSWAERRGLKLYMYVGSLEGVYKDNAQAQMLENTRSACRMILAQGYPAERLNYVEEEGGTHDLLFFAKHLPEVLSWLYE